MEAGKRGQSVIQSEFCRDETCECDTTAPEDNGGATGQTVAGDSEKKRCICPVIRQNDCIADLDSFRDGQLIISVTVQSETVLRSIVEGLHERGATVHLERIVPLSGDQGGRAVVLDATSMTDKQREAIQLAVQAGYYDNPRSADLDDLAQEIGVSRSAVSQRLNAVESKLVKEFAGAELTTTEQTDAAE